MTLSEYLDESLGTAVSIGISFTEFWLMEREELEAVKKVWQRKYREGMELWRMQTYYAAAHFFDHKKTTPSVSKWHPFPWDNKESKAKYFAYKERMEIAKAMGREDWIPQNWKENVN